MANLKDLSTQDLTRTFRKMLPFTEAKAEEKTGTDPDVAGEIEGYAAGLLNIDKGEDIIFPGAFEEADPGEVVVAYQHDITSIIGRPLTMEERLEPDYGLFTKSEIVSTSLGVDVMKLVRRGILKKMSIGYRLISGGYSMMNRDSLVGTLKDFSFKGRGIPANKQAEITADFDRRKLDGVFGLFKLGLREYSIVTFPMNDNAAITSAKGEFGNLLDGLPFSLHPALVLAANKGYVDRARDLFKTYRQPDNRSLGAAHKDALEIIAREGALVASEAGELLREMLAIEQKGGVDEQALIESFLTLNAELDARLAGHV